MSYDMPNSYRSHSNEQRKPPLMPLRDLGVNQQEHREHHRRE